MGRNYIAERTWADPKQRAAQKALKRQRNDKRSAAIALADTRIRERLSVCWVKGCGKLNPGDWLHCCSEQCYRSMLKELDRRAEVKEARRQGVPVAEYRKQNRQ